MTAVGDDDDDDVIQAHPAQIYRNELVIGGHGIQIRHTWLVFIE